MTKIVKVEISDESPIRQTDILYLYLFKVAVVIAQISFRFVGLGMGLAATNKSFGLVM